MSTSRIHLKFHFFRKEKEPEKRKQMIETVKNVSTVFHVDNDFLFRLKFDVNWTKLVENTKNLSKISTN